MSTQESKKYFLPNTKFSSLNALHTIIIIGCVLLIVEAVVLIFGMISEVIYHTVPAWTNIILANEDFFSGIFFILGIVMLMWLAKAYRNLYAFDKETTALPTTVVFESIIPLLNLKAIYQYTKEIWRNVVDKDNWNTVKVWWGMTLFSLLMSYVVKVQLPASSTIYLFPAEVMSLLVTTTAALLINIAVYLLSIKLVNQVTQAQETLALHLPTTYSEHPGAIKTEQTEPAERSSRRRLLFWLMVGIPLAIIVLFIVAVFIYASLRV